MGKASSSKKVARIASTGGGRTTRGRTPWLWYTALTAFVALGVTLVITSREGLDPTVGRPNFQDHWHMAYGIFICDQFKPPMAQPANLIGLHTHTDGLIHVKPQGINDTAENATVGRYQSGQPDFDIDENSIKYPGDKTYKNGDKCGSKAGRMEILQWDSRSDEEPSTVTGDPKDVKIEDGHLITFAFVPEGTTIPKPPSAGNLANPNAGETGSPPPPAGEGTPPADTATTVAGTATTVAGQTATTTAPAETATTTAP